MADTYDKMASSATLIDLVNDSSPDAPLARELDEHVQRHKIDRKTRHEELKKGGRSKNKQIDLKEKHLH